jgi:hypothetical protein
MSSGVLSGQPARETEADREARRQIYEITERLLEGKPLLVRVYTDPAGHPETFQQVTVPIQKCCVSPDAIRSAFGPIPDKSPLVILGHDQSHGVVAAVLGDCIFAGAYRRGAEALRIQPPLDQDLGHTSWLFVDALGQPIPGASVEIALEVGQATVLLAKGKLDAQGRLKCIPCERLVFTISHPNYGVGTTQYNGPSDIKSLPETYVVPLVAMNSPAAAGAIQGTVTDSQGKAVPRANVACQELTLPAGERINAYGRALDNFRVSAATDEQGRFAMYWPLSQDGVLLQDLIPAGSLYRVRIEPSTSLNLRVYEGSVIAGTSASVTLSAMQADEFFHTFTFEGHAGPITDPAELKHTVLTLIRDERPWAELTYDQWKNGCSLPLGNLMAATTRSGYPFAFKPIDLLADSPQEIVIKEFDAITYRGKVIDDATGKPMPNVLVGVGSLYANQDPCSLTPQQWQDMRNRATEQASAEFPSRIFYEDENRLTVTDANGEYEVIFLPGVGRSLFGLVAMQPGYAPGSVSLSYSRPDEDGVVSVPPLRLSPPASPAPSYFPAFVFEDEKGPVTDPNMLKNVRLDFIKDGSVQQGGSLNDFLERREFMPATYRATATWQGKYYVFEPVDLNQDRPETVVFKPREILTDSIVFQGQAVHGVTGRPIPQALVMDQHLVSRFDASGLTAEQWKAIKAMGPDFDPASPALAPLMQVIAEEHGTAMPRFAIADAQGRFSIAISREDTNFGRLAIMDRDFLCTEQQLVSRVRPPGSQTGPAVPERLGPEVNGQVTLSPVKLFPAGTVLVEPIVPENAYSNLQKSRLRLLIVTAKDDPTPWLRSLWASPVDNAWASVPRDKDLRPNMRQSLYVPADVKMALLLYDRAESRYAPLVVPDVTVGQGQVLDLGRLEFGPGVTVTIKVIDPAGNPVQAMRLFCMDDWYGQYGITALTDRDGIAEAHVAPSTKGKFAIYFFGRSTNDRLEASVPYPDFADSASVWIFLRPKS